MAVARLVLRTIRTDGGGVESDEDDDGGGVVVERHDMDMEADVDWKRILF